MKTAAMLPDRVLPYERIHNFRDYGGYAVTGGAMLKRGLLFRSAQHVDATNADLAAVGRLGLATVIDLRGPAEREAAPCPRPLGFAAQVIFVDEDTAGLAPHVEAAETALDAEGARGAMVASYAGMPFRPRMIPILKRYLAALATSEGPSLIHCLAGKDRTGFAVALFHEAMGVHRDDILADYMLTNVAGRIDERIEAGARHIRATFGKMTPDAAIRELMSVRPEYLHTALTSIEARHGTVFAYLRDVLELTEDRRVALAGRVVG